jgi:pimeloyl-ACP methyl ester carboxylesterase
MEISLNYVEKGSGRPIILLHGNGESHEYFNSQIEYFSRTRRVIAIDTRGHGKSPMGSAPFSLYTFADDLRDFMSGHGIPRADILGFSDGGNIALLFALKYPHMADRLILNGANLSFSGLTFKTAVQILSMYAWFCVSAPFSKAAAKNKALFRLMVKEPRIDPVELQSLPMPTLVIVGDHDMIARRHTRLIADSLQNSTLRILPGDHFIASKKPDSFNREVEKFLDDTERPC